MVFISWSREISGKYAKILRDWLPEVLQKEKFWYSEMDIEKGKVWQKELFEKLNSSDFGLLIVTKENLESRWFNFEAGALGIKVNTLYTLLFDLTDSDLGYPLSLFQTTKFNKSDFFKMIREINDNIPNGGVEARVLENTFNRCWPELENNIKNAMNTSKAVAAKTERPVNELIEEVLGITKAISKKLDSHEKGLPLQNEFQGYYINQSSTKDVTESILFNLFEAYRELFKEKPFDSSVFRNYINSQPNLIEIKKAFPEEFARAYNFLRTQELEKELKKIDQNFKNKGLNKKPD